MPRNRVLLKRRLKPIGKYHCKASDETSLSTIAQRWGAYNSSASMSKVRRRAPCVVTLTVMRSACPTGTLRLKR
jgi:hypothetical protein